MPGEEPPRPADARADAPLGQAVAQLSQEGLWLLPVDSKDPLGVRFDGRRRPLATQGPGAITPSA